LADDDATAADISGYLPAGLEIQFTSEGYCAARKSLREWGEWSAPYEDFVSLRQCRSNSACATIKLGILGDIANPRSDDLKANLPPGIEVAISNEGYRVRQRINRSEPKKSESPD
jgi:hypothetical protein